MLILFITLISIFSILASRFLFNKWFNPLSLYVLLWLMMLDLYQLRLMEFIDLSAETWWVIISGFLSFLLGILTLYFAQKSIIQKDEVSHEHEKVINIFNNDGNYIKLFIIIYSLIGLFSALQHWILLIHKYGNITTVLINAGLIYRIRVEGESVGETPYIFIFSYSAVFLGAIYTAYRKKFSFYTIFPFIGLILNELAIIGRAGIFFGFMEFVISFLFFKEFFYSTKKVDSAKHKYNFIIALTIVLTLVIMSNFAIKQFRGTFENYKASTKELNKFKGGLLITPSIYLYFSSSVGVLDKYLELNSEKTDFGQNSFLPIYSVLSKFDITKKPPVYQKGYYIPMWTNNGTYLREICADFGFAGIFIVPYLLGLFSTFFWFRYFEYGSINSLISLVYLCLIIVFSIFMMVTRMPVWSVSAIILFVTIPIIQKMNSTKLGK